MVRATFSGFSTAFSALQASQKRLDIVGQNLSNMNTPGYTRQQLETSSLNYSNPISRYMNGSQYSVGFGVSMDRVSQIRDPYLDAQYRAQIDKAGYSNSMQSALDTLSKALDESNIAGIHTALNDIQRTLGNMQDVTNTNDVIYESELRSRMQSFTNLLNDAARQIEAAEKAEYSKLDGTGTSEQGAKDKVNDMLRQIGDLNHQIKQNQILGQPSLELLDERNNLLDELSSYIPIEVTYFKDAQHDGKMTVPDLTDPSNPGTKVVDAPNELYDYDSNGNVIGRKEWPDDLKVELVYRDPDGSTKRLTLINGTEGTKGSNYGKLSMDGGSQTDPTSVSIKFTPAASSGQDPKSTSISTDGIQFSSGSIQASLDMLVRTGTGDPIANNSPIQDEVRGYQYYMNRLDDIAEHFAKTMNKLNRDGGDGDLFVNKTTDTTANITALTIGISKGWINGDVHIGRKGDSVNSTILNMSEAMIKSHSELGNKSFADYMNNVSTILANDSSSNSNSLKTNVTVLNGIQNSRDSMSGISLDEEAANMMTYMSAYNAASRLMTALDEALNTLINGTGLVGR